MRVACGLVCVAFGLFLGAPQSRADSSLAPCTAVPGNIVLNCGFETGDFTNWTLAGNDVPGELNNLYGVEGADPVDGISPNSGSFQAFFADLVANATTLSQTLITVPGGAYTVAFYLAQDTTPGTGGPPNSNEVVVSFSGVTLATVTAIPVEGYTLYSYSGVATSTSTALSLTLGNDLGETLLDDVSVSESAPEPSTWVSIGAGLLGLGSVVCRKAASIHC